MVEGIAALSGCRNERGKRKTSSTTAHPLFVICHQNLVTNTPSNHMKVHIVLSQTLTLIMGRHADVTEAGLESGATNHKIQRHPFIFDFGLLPPSVAVRIEQQIERRAYSLVVLFCPQEVSFHQTRLK